MGHDVDIRDWYISRFKDFENSLNGESLKPIHMLRKEAIEGFAKLNFPTTRDEEWRFTNISPILKFNFKPSLKIKKITKSTVEKFLFKELNCHLLVFINGHFAKEFSRTNNLPKGVVAGNINREISNGSELVGRHLGKYANHKEQIFTALSTAFTKDGAFIYVPDDKIIEEPIHILFITDTNGEQLLTQPRNLFITGKNSQVTILEHYASVNEGLYFTNVVTEVVAGENSIVDHIKLQEESVKSFHISRTEIDQERSSNFASHSISLGGEITRNDFNSRFNGQGGECTLNGLYLLNGNQLYDTHTMIDHANPYCNSHEHYKGILDGQSRGVFNGKIMVRRDAQKTNAFQENNNIILSNDALVNTKPQLEIFADDVKCSHGATIGQLDADSMFYLKARGIGEEKARTILIHAFASDVVRTVKIEALRNYFEKILNDRFNK